MSSDYFFKKSQSMALLHCVISFLCIVIVPTVAVKVSFASDKLPPDSLIFDHITIKDGLLNSVIYDIKQDRHGYIWLATGNGVSRYNGYDFVHYHSNDGTEKPLGDGPVVQILIDKASRLWVMVIGRGVYHFDEKEDTFRNLNDELPSGSKLPTDFVYNMVQDQSGVFWISTLESGLFRYDEKKSLKQYIDESDNEEHRLSHKLSGLFVDSRNRLWISSLDKGLYSLNLGTGKISHHLEEYPHAVGMCEDMNGDVWIPTLGSGIVRYVSSEDRFITYRNDPNDANTISHNQTVRALVDSDGVLWITTWGGGVNVFDRENERFIRYQNSPLKPTSLNNNSTWGIYFDKSRVLWVGTYGAGVNKYDRKKEKFRRLLNKPDEKNSQIGRNIKALYRCSNNYIWLGSQGGGLSRYDKKTKSYRHFLHDPNDPESLSSNNVWGISEGPDQKIWVATENGLNSFNLRTERFTRYLHNEKDPDSPSSNIIRSVFIDRQRRLWVGTQNHGVDLYDYDTMTKKNYTPTGGHHTVFHQDIKGRIWNGNAQTLNYYDEKKDVFKNAKDLFKSKKRNLIDGFYISINEDEQGRLWFAKTTGLFCYDTKGELIDYSGEKRLLDRSISDFQFDHLGRIWVSNSYGITLGDIKNQTFSNFELGTFNRGASIKVSDGMIYFGGLDGVTFFNPDKVIPNRYVPSVVITQLETLQQSYSSSILAQGGSNLLQIEHEDHFITIGFAALDYSNPRLNNFRYKLEGFDSKWRDATSKNRFATYTNLDPGDYLFRVIGSNSEGTWNRAGASINIQVLAPWWKTWWFYTLTILIPIVIFCLIFRSKTVQLKREKITSQKIRESEERFKLLFENSPYGIAHFDQDGVITTCNDNFAHIITGTKEQLVGADLLALFPSEHLMSAFSKTLSGQTMHLDESDIALKNHDLIPVRAMLGPVYSTDGNVTGGICTIEDISEEKRAEREKTILEKKLRQAMKMEAIGTLAGGIAHDFNNILSVILGNAEIAQFKLKKEEDHCDELEGIVKAGIRAKDLVKHILAFSRMDETSMEVIQPSIIVTEGLRMMRPIFPSTISIHADIQTDLPNILGDPAQVHQVLMNLCTNALHSMEATGGELEISLQKVELNDEDLSSEPDISPGMFIRLSVKDKGEGIPKEILDRVFDPYYTTKDTGRGTGLGLSIVHGLAKTYNGFVSIQSELKKGTRVDVFFPEYSGEENLKEEVQDIDFSGNERILLVDDEEPIVEANRTLLEELGYSVTGVSSSIEALRLFRDNPDGFDLVITDYTMPQLTGSQLAQELFAIKPGIPVVLCTGYSSNISENQAKEIGIASFAFKPLIKNEIASLVRETLDN